MWVIRHLNFDLNEAVTMRFLQVSEIEELQNDSYENAKIYKEKKKKRHEKHVLHKEFKEGNKVLIFNCRFKL